MTSIFRLYVASILAVAALVSGLFLNNVSTDVVRSGSARNWSPVPIPTAAEVDTFVSRVIAAGLFPNARLQNAGEEGTTDTALSLEELEGAFEDPSLAAFVSSGGVWTILIPRDGEDAMILREGDFLADVWQIVQITATTVSFERDDEEHLIDVFTVTDG